MEEKEYFVTFKEYNVSFQDYYQPTGKVMVRSELDSMLIDTAKYKVISVERM